MSGVNPLQLLSYIDKLTAAAAIIANLASHIDVDKLKELAAKWYELAHNLYVLSMEIEQEAAKAFVKPEAKK